MKTKHKKNKSFEDAVSAFHELGKLALEALEPYKTHSLSDGLKIGLCSVDVYDGHTCGFNCDFCRLKDYYERIYDLVKVFPK